MNICDQGKTCRNIREFDIMRAVKYIVRNSIVHPIMAPSVDDSATSNSKSNSRQPI